MLMAADGLHASHRVQGEDDMATGNQGPGISQAPASTAYSAGMGAFWGTSIGFPVWGLLLFLLGRSADPNLSIGLTGILCGAIGGAFAAYMTRARPL
jgi:hypothetical protein